MSTKAKHKERSQYRYHAKGIPATFSRHALIGHNPSASAGMLAGLFNSFIKPTPRESRKARDEEV